VTGALGAHDVIVAMADARVAVSVEHLPLIVHQTVYVTRVWALRAEVLQRLTQQAATGNISLCFTSIVYLGLVALDGSIPTFAVLAVFLPGGIVTVRDSSEVAISWTCQHTGALDISCRNNYSG